MILNRLFIKRKFHNSERAVFDINFPNCIGLGAGFDRNGEKYNSFRFGSFGYIQVGPLSPVPQDSNNKKHIFLASKLPIRINKGIRNAINNVQRKKPEAILSFTLTHHSHSVTEEDIIKDYSTAFSLSYDFADFFTIDTTIPNLDGSTPLQDNSLLFDILDDLLDLRLCYDKYKPIVVKILADIPEVQLEEVLSYCRLNGIDGLNIAAGQSTLTTVRYISEHCQGRYPIIASLSAKDKPRASEMIKAGASLLEVSNENKHINPFTAKKIAANIP